MPVLPFAADRRKHRLEGELVSLQKIALTSVEKGFCGHRIEWIIMAAKCNKIKKVSFWAQK